MILLAVMDRAVFDNVLRVAGEAFDGDLLGEDHGNRLP
jgi:hypothetical protein